MLVYVSYRYHAYLKSRPKIKYSCSMEHGKTFCNFFGMDVHREKIPGFASKKKLKKLLIDFDFHISSMFLYLILIAYFSQYSRKGLTVSWNFLKKEYQ